MDVKTFFGYFLLGFMFKLLYRGENGEGNKYDLESVP
jgi:hypothetical protein